MSSDIHEFGKVLAKTLKQLRKEAKMTQVDLSGKLDISVVHISNIENGHCLPSIQLLRAYKSILGVDPYCVTSSFLNQQSARSNQLRGIVQEETILYPDLRERLEKE